MIDLDFSPIGVGILLTPAYSKIEAKTTRSRFVMLSIIFPPPKTKINVYLGLINDPQKHKQKNANNGYGSTLRLFLLDWWPPRNVVF